MELTNQQYLYLFKYWKQSRPHPIAKTVASIKNKKMFWNSKKLGTYKKSIHKDITDDEKEALRHIREVKNIK